MRATALQAWRSCGRNLHGGGCVSAGVRSGRSCRRRRGMSGWQLPRGGVRAGVEVVRPAIRVVERLPPGAATLVCASRATSRPVLRCFRSAPIRALCTERASEHALTLRPPSCAPPPSLPLPPLPPPPSSCASWPPTRAPHAPPRRSWAQNTRSARPAKKPRAATWPPNQLSRLGSAQPGAPPCRRCCSRGWTSLHREARSAHASAPGAPRRQRGAASACINSVGQHAPAGRRSL